LDRSGKTLDLKTTNETALDLLYVDVSLAGTGAGAINVSVTMNIRISGYPAALYANESSVTVNRFGV